ncbi:MAG: GreA/GreB family elongation factor [Bacilli bacterium]|nr:GreA/GreB family elongation factor [Bacilli bacterium]
MAENIILTQKGKIEKEERLRHLIDVELPKADEELNFARSQGDLSENADYDAANAKRKAIAAEIENIKDILDHCTVIDDAEDEGGVKTVRLGGGEIKVVNLDTKVEYHFSLVGSVESDPLNKKISNVSPVGQAVIGHKVGDIVEVKVKKPYKLKILSIA